MSDYRPWPWILHECDIRRYGDESTTHICEVFASNNSTLICDINAEYENQSANARLIATAPELLDELKRANQIIHNALNIMRIQDKRKWEEANHRDGVDGEGITRANERDAVIAKAEGKGEVQ